MPADQEAAKLRRQNNELRSELQNIVEREKEIKRTIVKNNKMIMEIDQGQLQFIE